jgi:hypothetical protein
MFFSWIHAAECLLLVSRLTISISWSDTLSDLKMFKKSSIWSSIGSPGFRLLFFGSSERQILIANFASGANPSETNGLTISLSEIEPPPSASQTAKRSFANYRSFWLVTSCWFPTFLFLCRSSQRLFWLRFRYLSALKFWLTPKLRRSPGQEGSVIVKPSSSSGAVSSTTV